MTNPVTYEQVESLAKQLAPREQLRLLAEISDRLCKQAIGNAQTTEGTEAYDYPTRVETFLQMIEENAGEATGEVDSAVDIGHIREERALQR